jgi:hypothetical protein
MNMAIFVDLDSTLVLQAPLKEHPAAHELTRALGPLSVLNMSEDDLLERLTQEYGEDFSLVKPSDPHYLSMLCRRRPGALEFLDSLHDITPEVYCLTMGLTEHQTKVVESLGMLGKVKGVFGRDQLDRVPRLNNPILVDDLPHDHPNSAQKLRAMGDGARCIVVDPYDGCKADDVFGQVLSEIMESLGTQKAAAWVRRSCKFG